MAIFKALAPGDPAPWFRARSLSRPDFAFDTVAGRYLVLGFLGVATDRLAQAALQHIVAAPEFDDTHASFFGVTVSENDVSALRERIPGIRWFLDFDGRISSAYGAKAHDDPIAYRRMWVVLDPALRVIAVLPFSADNANADELLTLIKNLPPANQRGGLDAFPPVLVLPNVFEPDLRQTLIDSYERGGGEESGFMRDIDGKTVLVQDHAHKRRRDFIVSDPELVKRLQQRVQRRIVPEIDKAFQFHVTRMERYLVGCYRADEGGHFRPHRDNTTKGTAHRRFAVTINLNSDFEGGELSFPEFSRRSLKPEPGCAVVFSCSLLHTVSPVTSGARYAFLPFLYDDAAADVRAANLPYLAEQTAMRAD